MIIYRIAKDSVIDPVKMFAVRKIGDAVPVLKFTHNIEDAEKWLAELSGREAYEVVRVIIMPQKTEWRNLKYNTDWNSIDWDNKTDEQIAKEENRDIRTVRSMRSRIAPETILKPDENQFKYSPRGPGMWNKQIDTLLGLK